MLKKEDGGYKTRHDWNGLGFLVTSLTGLISTWSEVQVSMWSQEYYYYCVSNSCINYFKKLLPLKKTKKQKKKPQAIFVSVIDIWTGFMFDALFGKFAIQTGIRIPYSDDALLCIFLLESRTNFRFSAWWIFIFFLKNFLYH